MSKATMGTCPNCRKPDFIMPLHGEHGGPLMCLQCGMDWHAKYTRRAKFGRIVVKAMNLFLENGGRFKDIDKFKLGLSCARLGINDPGLNFYGADIGAEVGDITSELLADVLQLTHPDKHPPERRELAKRVTQDLLALKPFVFPAPKPKPTKPVTPPSDDLAKRAQDTVKKASPPPYPCAMCAATVPFFYCATCKARYQEIQEADREQRRAKQREQYARRQKRRKLYRPSRLCAGNCGTEIKALRKDAKFCSPACRQKAHRQRVTATPSIRADEEIDVTRRAVA